MNAEAVHTATYLRNRAPTRALISKTPYEEWYGVKPSVSHLRTFGSLATALDKKEHNKFKPRGRKFTMVGYSETSKAYRLYNKKTNKLIVSRDVYFIESEEEIMKPSVGTCQKGGEGIIDLNNENIQSTNVTDVVVNETDISSVGEEVVSQQQQYPEDDETSSEEFIFEDEQLEDTIREQELQLVEARRGPGRPSIIRTGKPGRPKKQYNKFIADK